MQATGTAVAATLAYELTNSAPTLAVDNEADNDWKLVNTEEYTNICCYCAGGCGSLCSVRAGELINLEGDPDHPINQGGLCPKGATVFQLRNIVDPETGEVMPNPDRATKPMVRRPGASEWEKISWDDAICDECGGYLRTRFDEASSRAPLSYEVEDVVMARLDAIANDPSFAGHHNKNA